MASKNNIGGDNKMKNLKINELRRTTDEMVDKIDQQALKNFELNLEVKSLKSELIHNLEKLGEHTYCPDQEVQCTSKKSVPSDSQQVQETKEVAHSTSETHGADCHCSKCCPHPSFLQRNKVAILVGILSVAMIILAVGWSPTGAIAEAINTSWVELFVDFFKMAILAVAAIVIYQLIKKKDE